MSELMQVPLALLAGLLLGAIFFGGLWWTVARGIGSNQPALWFGLSFLLRTGIALAGFYVASGSDWRRLLACLLGFVVARAIMIRLAKALMARESRHAP